MARRTIVSAASRRRIFSSLTIDRRGTPDPRTGQGFAEGVFFNRSDEREG